MSLLTSQAWSKILNITGWKKELPESEMSKNKSKHLIVSSLVIIIVNHLKDGGNNKNIECDYMIICHFGYYILDV